MAKWIKLPSEPLIEQPDQTAFLEARRMRICPGCTLEFKINPEAPSPNCPECGAKGMRVFDRLLILAGRRYGKSKFGSIAGVEEACIPGTIGWACAPTNPKLHRYVIPAFQQLIPEDWVEDWNSEYKDLRLKNGSLIHFQTLEDPDQGRGQGLDWLWIDEVCELSEKHWDVIRPSLGDKLGGAFFTTSPRSFDWVYEKFYSPAEQQVPGYWALHGKTRDNPKFKTPEGRAFLEAERLSMSDEMYRQEYEADFVTFTGAVFGALLEPQIVRDPDVIRQLIPEWPQIEPWRQRIIGIDTGADHPFGAVKIISTEKGLVVVGDYLERAKSFLEHAQGLHGLAGSANTRWAANKNEKQGMIELGQHGIFCAPAANDVVAGIERIKSWLKAKQLWFIESHCPRTIKQMKGYRWAENYASDGSAMKEKVYKKNDELPDCLRYALMIWPKLPSGPPQEAEKERDISHFSGEVQASIQRLRRLDKPKTEPETVTGDFWS